jgi:hypothetical protein
MVITINAIMDYAVNIGVIEHNPLSKIGKAFPAEKNEPRATLQKKRLPEFLSAWKELSLWEPSKLALLFQIITMVGLRRLAALSGMRLILIIQSGKSLQAG